MSKGSLFFGNASGKLGQVVLSTLKGQQIARAWQPKVANPKTSQQQLQRAKFANAVKFFKRAQRICLNSLSRTSVKMSRIIMPLCGITLYHLLSSTA